MLLRPLIILCCVLCCMSLLDDPLLGAAALFLVLKDETFPLDLSDESCMHAENACVMTAHFAVYRLIVWVAVKTPSIAVFLRAVRFRCKRTNISAGSADQKSNKRR